MKTLIIIRGVSGSGKSALARSMMAVGFDNHLEADMFFTNPVTGEYNFSRPHLHDAHIWCKDRVQEIMRGDDDNDIIVSNTFTRKWEIEPYIDLAKEYGYTVQLITVDGKFGNIHDVPEEKVQQMRDRFEHLTLEDFGL